MKPFRWSHAKNERLKIEQQISFEEIVLAFEDGKLLDILKHSNPDRYPNQRLMVVAWNRHAYLVPFVEEPEYFFLKTIIPSRKATRDCLESGVHDDQA